MRELPFSITPKNDIEKWRLDTFWTKEPETIAWIDSFLPRDYLLDVGANIGLYSFYAASRGCKVLAIEPHPANSSALALNSRYNKYCPVKTFWCAVGTSDGLVEFKFSDATSGSSDGGYRKNGTNTIPIPMYSIDRLNKTFGPFDHIKIDVDGEEDLVVLGMNNCLRDATFRTCLIEVDEKNRDFVCDTFYRYRYHGNNPLNFISDHSRNRRAKEGIRVENIIFSRIE